MPSNGVPPKVDAHVVVYAETAIQANFLLNQPSRTEAVRSFVKELLASLRRTQFDNRDVQIEGFDFAHEKAAAETVRAWVTEILDSVEAKNNAFEVKEEVEPPVPGALRGTVTRTHIAFTHVAVSGGRSYSVNGGGIPGARAGATEVWIVPTGGRNEGKLEARFVCRVSEERPAAH